MGYKFNEEQKNSVNHKDNPLWVVAGPGSGKTEVLVVRTLKLIFVDGVNPKSIILTTFTKKASQNLFDRIIKYSTKLYDLYPELKGSSIEIHSLRVGTLHSLCNDIMKEYKYTDYENYKLINEIENYIFVYNYCPIAKYGARYKEIWTKFRCLVGRYDKDLCCQIIDYKNKARLTSATITLFNRIIEDKVNIDKLKNGKIYHKKLAEECEKYLEKLEGFKLCTFSTIQLKFIDFLNSEDGELFLSGSGYNPPIKHIMVDEYQDTNPIQEEIYFKMAKQIENNNLCVVGDDDQAMYRFRGGTVECMVNFDKTCVEKFNIPIDKINKIFLKSNYRSHPDIVKYYDDYINSYKYTKDVEMERARVKDKPQLVAKKEMDKETIDNYLALNYIEKEDDEKLAEEVANTIKYFKDNDIIEDYSQCVILIKSTREIDYNGNDSFIGHIRQKLLNNGIDIYNPRSKNFLNQEEIKLALGAFISIVDTDISVLENNLRSQPISNEVVKWYEEYQNNKNKYPELKKYVDSSVEKLKTMEEGSFINSSIENILYKIYACYPFTEWLNDEEKSYRLAKLTNLFNSYSTIPTENLISKGSISIDGHTKGKVDVKWLIEFYGSLVGHFLGGIDDIEDEEITIPEGKVPIMTVHQAKGLEFPFVFVYLQKWQNKANDGAILEREFAEFTDFKRISTIPRKKTFQDIIRFHYVAYSRAQYGLIHLWTSDIIDKKNNHKLYGFIKEHPNNLKIYIKNTSYFKNNINKIN
ncbi:UvrD/REP helicase [Methanococcus aeolicus Nankai-3]|uniref:DNA 3'-5' helicase n=1 Tax=Methanococcus aeolicus (strain ATCC BAA-1280 / DSM 17508 / OCM 812 / Nankai-3) TaxID=419665 RepID=A6UTK0_META3|nr:ATP-dependent helicase [Methanococcus aeolicus]ABR55822.1 UvrD/REP helicase [Methanococcus aeolicus Nankai-3]